MAKTILIAEDLENDATILRQTLKTAGVDNPIMTVSDGDEVTAYLSATGRYADREAFPFPAVLLLDLKMDRVDGYQVLEWLGQNPKFRPSLVVVLTGYGSHREAQKAYNLGAQSFLTKPCSIEDLHNLIQAFPGYWEMKPPPSLGASSLPVIFV